MTWKPCCERCSRFNSQQITFSVTLLVRDLKTMLWEMFTVQQSTDYFFCNTFSPWLENHAVMLWEMFTVQQSTDYFFCNTFSPWLENHAVRCSRFSSYASCILLGGSLAVLHWGLVMCRLYVDSKLMQVSFLLCRSFVKEVPFITSVSMSIILIMYVLCALTLRIHKSFFSVSFVDQHCVYFCIHKSFFSRSFVH